MTSTGPDSVSLAMGPWREVRSAIRRRRHPSRIPKRPHVSLSVSRCVTVAAPCHWVPGRVGETRVQSGVTARQISFQGGGGSFQETTADFSIRRRRKSPSKRQRMGRIRSLRMEACRDPDTVRKSPKDGGFKMRKSKDANVLSLPTHARFQSI